MPRRDRRSVGRHVRGHVHHRDAGALLRELARRLRSLARALTSSSPATSSRSSSCRVARTPSSARRPSPTCSSFPVETILGMTSRSVALEQLGVQWLYAAGFVGSGPRRLAARAGSIRGVRWLTRAPLPPPLPRPAPRVGAPRDAVPPRFRHRRADERLLDAARPSSPSSSSSRSASRWRAGRGRRRSSSWVGSPC